jgi:hypothetical protein
MHPRNLSLNNDLAASVPLRGKHEKLCSPVSKYVREAWLEKVVGEFFYI